MPNASIVTIIVSEISAFIRTDGKIDSASGPDQEYIHFMGSETLPSACYILFDESSIPFYFSSNGYNKSTDIGLYSPFVFSMGRYCVVKNVCYVWE